MDYYKQWSALPCIVEDWQKDWAEFLKPALSLMNNFINTNYKSVLDVGCGVALNAEHITITYTGIDITPKFVKESKRKGYNVYKGNILKLPFEDESFDCSYTVNVITHLKPNQWKKAFDEMLRVSKKAIIILDKCWSDNTEYIQKEHFSTKDGELHFYNNVYGKSEICNYLKTKNVKTKTFWNEEKTWQLTIIEKIGEESVTSI